MSFDYQAYAAPKTHGDAVIEPAVERAAAMMDKARSGVDLWPTWIRDLQSDARGSLIRNARRYTSAYRDVSFVDSADDSTPMWMAGHQPTLFHPGVWFKNFALSHLAELHGGLGINLVIDNDVASGVSVRSPTIDLRSGRWTTTTVAYDRAGGGVPYEQTAIGDRELFASFPERLQRTLIGVVDDPSAFDLWPHAMAAIDRCDIAACALAQARHGLEADLGLRTLEIPMGVVARDASFLRFVIEILAELPRFVEAYNRHTAIYRSIHGIRSSSHPVPDLSVDGECYEMPLWVYGDSSPVRRPVWACREGDRWTVGDREGVELTLDLSDRDAAARQWSEAQSSEVKFRPRALLTTMYARMVLSDVFLHGIGGGKYDQLGDRIAEEFFGIRPPEFMVMSATVTLPPTDDVVDGAKNLAKEKSALIDARRATVFSPERFAGDLPDEAKPLAEQKRGLLGAVPSVGTRKDWHDEVSSLNRRMSSYLDDRRDEIDSAMMSLQDRMGRQRLLDSREHPFCVLPLNRMTDAFSRML